MLLTRQRYKRPRSMRLALLLSLYAWPVLAHSEKLYVIVNPTSGVEQLSKTEVVNIYMGRDQTLTRQLTALPIDINAEFPEKGLFYQRLINRDIAEVNSYWVRVMFSGNASPPREVDNYERVKSLIRNNQSTIAYVPEAVLNQLTPEDYKVVYVLNP